MPEPIAFENATLTAWRTNCRVTAHFVKLLPPALWTAAIPGVPSRTVRSIAAHLHNARRSWVKTLGGPHGIPDIPRVDHRTVTQRQLLPALDRSARGMAALLQLAFEHGGSIPPTKAYVWRNLALDAGHVLTYFVAHEAHHRGQIVLVARQLGMRLPTEVTGGLWDWRVREGDARR